MEGVKRSRSLKVFAASSENDISPKRSTSARFELLERLPSSRKKVAPRDPEDGANCIPGLDSGSTEQFFDVEIPGALSATGVFRSRSQRVYVSELPESLQSVVAESRSARYSSATSIQEDVNEDGTGLNKKSSQKVDDASKDVFPAEPAKNKNASVTAKGKVQGRSVPYLKLFKYADSLDIFMMVVGTICAIVDGLIWPAIAFVQSKVINKFANLIHSNPEAAAHNISKYALILVYISIVSGVSSYLEVSCWMYTGERQANRIRAKYVRAILRQNVGYFDMESSNTAAVVSSVSADTMLLQDAISEKVGNTIQNLMQFVGGLALGFYLAWRLALSIVPFVPFLVFPGIVYGRALLDLAVRIQIAYGKAGIVAEQAISSVRTVYSFVEEKRTLQVFSNYLEGAVSLGKKQGLAKGLAIGLTGQTFLAWAFVMWYGTYQFTHGITSGGNIVFCAFIILFSGLGLGSIAPNIKCMMEGAVASYRIFEMIERVPPIDIDDHSQRTLEKVDGNLELRNVDFSYPSRMHAPIFKNFNLQIPAGKTVALVGSSGSGKSTVVALLERFYDPTAGQVLIDGVDIKNLHLRWLRKQIGLVSQEPALFATSIVANILYGKDHSSMEEVIEAAKAANAHNFISQLPDGYETQVGERGVQLSGGQKQRIAIARTMLKKPPVLLLDEATSALDAESEKVVQQALEAAAVGRTTVVVAHRLSTVRSADTIAVLQLGKVVEMGSHAELMARGPGGAYYALVNLQASSQDKTDGGIANGHKGLGVPVKRNSYQHQSSVSDQDMVDTYVKRDSDLNTATKQHTQKPQADVSLMRLLKLNKPEWKEGLLGFLGAVGYGFPNPCFATIIALLTTDYYADLSHHELWHKVKIYISCLCAIFVFFLTTNTVQHYYFAVAGEYLTKRTREHMLSSILSFEVGWFDRDANSSGSVCSRLASDANMVRSLIGDRISLVTGALSMVVVSWIICFVVSWRFGVVVIFLHPLIIFCYYMKKALLISFAKKTAIAQARASQVASEAVAQHRTVTAFSAQEKVVLLFKENLAGPTRAMLRRSRVAGITFGVANLCAFSAMAFLYWYGGVLGKKGLASFQDFFIVFLVFVNTSRTIGEAGALAPDMAKASVAINNVFEIIDRTTEIDADMADAEKLTKVEGRVELKNVYFAYPSRPDVMVLKSFNLKVQAGCSAAMVGQSGSGKSTIIGLIERFYDPLQGAVLIDGRNLRTMNLQSVRLHIALVSQEPTLFAMSIRDNIAFGKEGATESEIIEAAHAANAHNFISALPQGYATFAGDRGLQLSGGQRQRIAIARAFLKNPKILLLDEATSALDAESERVVQEALDRMMVGRTTFIVAHRLSTIQNADTIAVLQEGVILEQGKHAELLAKGERGTYYNLVHLQTGGH